MIFFLSVLFVCNTTECTFLKSDNKFFKQAECVEVTMNAVKSAREKGLVAEGICLAVNTKDLL
jgi:hypothetical protein